MSKNQGKPGSGRPWNNSFGLGWIQLQGPEGHRSTCIRNRETPAGCKPNQPKPSVEKLLDVAFWRPKERWRKANATASLTWQAASKPFQKHPKPCSGRGWNGSFGGSFGLGWIELIRAPRTWSGRGMRNNRKPQQDSSPTSQNHPSKNCLTLLSDAL